MGVVVLWSAVGSRLVVSCLLFHPFPCDLLILGGFLLAVMLMMTFLRCAFIRDTVSRLMDGKLPTLWSLSFTVFLLGTSQWVAVCLAGFDSHYCGGFISLENVLLYIYPSLRPCFIIYHFRSFSYLVLLLRVFGIRPSSFGCPRVERQKENYGYLEFLSLSMKCHNVLL
ncbi:hypothetical protein V8F33_012823 [Rhypophila sp. PSN 637]